MNANALQVQQIAASLLDLSRDTADDHFAYTIYQQALTLLEIHGLPAPAPEPDAFELDDDVDFDADDESDDWEIDLGPEYDLDFEARPTCPSRFKTHIAAIDDGDYPF